MNFSVLMSVYYKEKPEYFDSSLKSVFTQTLMPTEVVIIKDGPLTDELENIIAKYQEKYESIIKTYALEKNSGLGVALNYGIGKCKYDIIARMDTDDFSIENRFEKQINVFLNDSTIDLVGSNIVEYDETMQNVISSRNVPEKDNEIKRFIKKRNPINHVSAMYKKNSVIDAGNYLDCPYFEDYYLWCRMAKNGCKFYNIQESLVNVRGGLSMIERRGGSSYNIDILNFQRKILELGIIGKIDFLSNLFVRVTISSMPSSIRMKFYKLKLRKSK